jgi:putative superfamily III holin-X
MITSEERIFTGQTRTAPLAAEPIRYLLRQLLKDLSTLCRQEMALAKADLCASLCTARRSIAVLVIGSALVFCGFLALLSAAIVALGAIMPMWLGALLVGITVVILGCVLLKVGQSGVGAARLAPMQSKESLRRDKNVLVRSGS